MAKKRRKRSASATWRRPRNMPIHVWEEVNENLDAEMIAWARTLIVEDDDGHVRKLTEEEVLAIAKAGHWEGSSRAARKTAKKQR
jgi:hypothetical protein